MATNPTTERRSLYPPEHPRKRRRYYFDDTLDAYPPLRRRFPGEPTPEAMEAARQLAAQRGYPKPQLPPEADGGQETPRSAAPSANGALIDQPKSNASVSRATRK